jgi:membrane associated rhomboid family serine protease
MRWLHAPGNVRSLLALPLVFGVILAALWLPAGIADILPLCERVQKRWHRTGLIGGGLAGWLLRYLLWRRTLRHW